MILDHIAVYDENQTYLGYLVLNDQMYFPYTPTGQFLGKGFFYPDHAEAYLSEYYQQNKKAASSPKTSAPNPTASE